jgi:hypothetical protein
MAEPRIDDLQGLVLDETPLECGTCPLGRLMVEVEGDDYRACFGYRHWRLGLPRRLEIADVVTVLQEVCSCGFGWHTRIERSALLLESR